MPCKRQECTTWHVRTGRGLVSFLFFFFRDRALSFQKEERESLARDSLEKIATVRSCCWGLGGRSPRSSVATPLPPSAPSVPSAVGLAPSARQ